MSDTLSQSWLYCSALLQLNCYSWPGPSGPAIRELQLQHSARITPRYGKYGERRDSKYLLFYLSPFLTGVWQRETSSEETLGILTSDQTGFKLPHHHFLRQPEFRTEESFHWMNLPTLRAPIGRVSPVTEYNIGPG